MQIFAKSRTGVGELERGKKRGIFDVADLMVRMTLGTDCDRVSAGGVCVWDEN
jgi:hypothetical protein